jgi:MGT family glycosyltransferase
MPSATIAFFPEAAYGPALNSVAIAQALQRLGHRAVFLSDPGFAQVYQDYGFETHPVCLSAPMPADQMARFWEDFINGHIPNFRKSPYDQIDNYVKDCWAAIVDSAKWAQKDLPGVLQRVKPDVICVDNVILFPAIKQHGVPWVRIISCSENEIEDPDIPPHLSGCAQFDRAAHARYRARFAEVIGPIHQDYNAFLAAHGEAPYPAGEFFETSPYLNLLLYPEPLRYQRRHALAPERFQYLEGCVRQERPYAVPSFERNAAAPLVYVSFGSLGAGDVELMQRLVAALGRLPVRALVNVGAYRDRYRDVPGNVILESWFPQPSVIPQVDAVIHHGGNNSFTECLYFGKPAIIMPYVWDGHDNAVRLQETGYGFHLHRYEWTDAELAQRLKACFDDQALHARLGRIAAHMRGQDGPAKAAALLDRLVQGQGGAESRRAAVIAAVGSQQDLADWGLVPSMLEGRSRTSGRVLHKGPAGQSECGIWRCTPGRWTCHVTRDEFCHFLSGRCTYVHESGEVIEIGPDTAAFFPQGWIGVCTVHEIVTKVYMIR